LFHEFKLENRSAKSISIQALHPSCGCIVATGYKKELLPGQSTIVKVEIKLPPVPGPIRKAILVETSPSLDRMVLQVVGRQRLNASLRCFPPVLDFGTVKKGESKTRTLRINRYDGTPVHFKSISFADDSMRVSRGPVKEEDGQEAIDVSLDSRKLPVGDYKSNVAVACLHDVFTVMNVSVLAAVVAPDKSF